MSEDSSRKERKKEEEELLNNIINESTTTNICAICKTQTQTQKHHLSYDPELVIDVCIPCHIKIHQHGVGRFGVKTKQEALTKEFEERKLWLPLFTNVGKNAENNEVILSKEGELLTLLTCPNCGMWHFSFQLLSNLTQKRTFLRCASCGFDIEVELISRREDHE